MKKVICFLTYPRSSVINYRHELIKNLEQDYDVKLISPVQYFLFNFDLVVSSNTISNLFTLCFVSCKKVIILNGFGRLYKRRTWRILFVNLMKMQKGHKCKIITQNYRDYRFLKRYGITSTFIMGSGGASFRVINRQDIIVVSRDKKIETQYASISKFLRLHSARDIKVYGTTRVYQPKLKGLSFEGRVERSVLLTNAKYIFHPQGYGDGFPHSLADAICSGVSLIMDRKLFVEYGLCHVVDYYRVINGFLIIPFGNKKNLILQSSVGASEVNKRYIEVVSRLMNKK